jgi:hypothetical protein
MANLAEKLLQILKINFPKMLYVKLLSSDTNKKDIDFAGSLPSAITNHASIHGENVIGTNNANGTDIATYNLAAGRKLAIMNVNLNCNAAVVIRIGSGPLATVTALGEYRLAAAGDINRSSESHPLLVVDNSTGSAVLAVRVYMPHTIDGAANNDAVTKYAGALVTGQLL